MKKHIAILIITALLLTTVFSFGSVALATTGVDFNITANPTELSSEGNVTFSFNVTNNGSVDYNDCAVYLNNQKVSGGDIGPLNIGNTFPNGSFTLKVSPGVSLAFQVRDGGQNVLAEKSVSIGKTANVDLGATATVNRTLAGTGNTVTLSVALENKGNVDITNINVSATGLNNNKAFNSSAFALGVGRSHTINHSFTMGSSDITFTPKITYTADGQNYTKELDAKTITLESRSVSVSVSASNRNPQPGEDVAFTLSISNSGNVSYTDLSVSMNGEDVRFPSKKLSPGDSFTETYTRSYQTSTEVIFSITLKDHTGAVLNVNSNTVNIQLPVDTERVNLDFSMKADRLQLTSAGVVNFTGSVYNGSEYTLTDISVDEIQFGNVYAASTLDAGQRAQIQWTANIDETTAYRFVFTATDADGNVYTLETDEISITVAAIEEPTPDYADAPTIRPDDDIEYSPTLTLLIIAGVLIVLIIGVGVALLVLWKKGRTTGARPSKGRPTAGPRKTPPGKKRPAPRQKSYRDRNSF